MTDKKVIKGLSDLEKVLSLMTKYRISIIKIDGIELTKNLHEMPEIKKTNTTQDNANPGSFEWPATL